MKGNITVAGQHILLPMIRQVYPSIIANQILGVQPMNGAVGGVFALRANYSPQSKYKFSRAKWYVAEINDNSLWRLSKEYNDMIEWCTEQFGPHPKYKDAWSRWWVGHGDIRFRDEKDYVLFVLKWS